MKHQLSDIESIFCNLKPTDNCMILLQLQCLSLTGNYIGSLYYDLPVKHNYVNAEYEMATPFLKILRYSHLKNHLFFGALWCSWSVVVLHCQKPPMLQILCKRPLCVFSPFSKLFWSKWHRMHQPYCFWVYQHWWAFCMMDHHRYDPRATQYRMEVTVGCSKCFGVEALNNLKSELSVIHTTLSLSPRLL